MRLTDKKKTWHWGKMIAYAILIIHLIITLLPLYIMIVTSLKTNKEIFSSPLSLPSSFNLDGYSKVLKLNNFARFFGNSILVTAASIAIYTFVSLLAAYAIGRFRFRGNGALYIYFLIGMMVPIRIGVINMFDLFQKLNLYDSLLGLILIYSAMSIGFSVFIMASFMRTIPREIEEAARIDGCSSWQILWSILVPILKPAIATAVISPLCSLKMRN